MKVLYLINYAGSGGSERYVELLCEQFRSKCGCGLCYHVPGPLVEKIQAMGLPTHQISMKQPLDLGAAKAVAELCRREGYEVIHAQYPRENDIALLSRLFGSGVRVVFTSHLILEQPLPWRLLNRIFTPHNHAVLTVCTAGRRVLERNGVAGNKIRLVFNGVDAAKLPPRDRSPLEEFGIGPEETVFTILTRFSPEKGVPFLLRAAAALKVRTNVPFRVLVVGDGPEFDAGKALVAELGLQDRVILTGFRRDTSRLLAASDIYLNSSASEAMSFAILEALGAGLPLVVTDVGGNPELVHQGRTCGIVVPYGDESAYAAAMARLLEDPALRADYAAEALAKARHEFDLHRLQEQIYEIYQ